MPLQSRSARSKTRTELPICSAGSRPCGVSSIAAQSEGPNEADPPREHPRRRTESGRGTLQTVEVAVAAPFEVAAAKVDNEVTCAPGR